METPVTNAVLEKKLTAYKRRKPESTYQKPLPIKKKVTVLQNAKSYFEKKTGMYTKSDIQTFLDELRVLVSFMENQVETAPEIVSMKQTDKKPVPQV
jgi:hypothetical protein